MYKYTIFATNGTITKLKYAKQPSLQIMQNWVEGYIESAGVLNVLVGDEVFKGTLFVNEEGKLKGLPINPHFPDLRGTVFLESIS